MDKEIIRFKTPTLPINIVTLGTHDATGYREDHLHNEIELICVEEGSISCLIEGETIELSAGMLLLVNKGVTHKISPLSYPEKFTYIQIDIDSLSRTLLPDEERILYSFLGGKKVVRYVVDKKESELGEIFSSILREADKKESAFEFYIKANILWLIAYMSRNGLLPFEQAGDSLKLRKIIDVIKFVDRNYNNQITLEDACSICGISKCYFCRLFKELTGSSFTEYLNFVRLSYVERELSSTDKSISEIAFDSGFTSIQYFNRTFKKYKKCTPKAYRKMIIEGFVK